MKRSAPGAQNSPIDLPLEPAHKTFGQLGIEQSQPELPLEPAPGRSCSSESSAALEEHIPGSTAVAPGRRLAAAVLDLAVHLGALAAAVAGSWWLGVPPSRLSLFPLLLLISCFSFVYHVLPLTFWGYTPGMASVGLVARASGGGPLTIGQAMRRWLGVLLNFASLGLLFALSKERSISDRLSGSTVHA